ncbi:hypothetical protein Bbelb_037790, partial [Branchiostoma belcheri]
MHLPAAGWKDYEIVSPECGELRILRYNSGRHDSTSMIFGRHITAVEAKVKYKFRLRGGSSLGFVGSVPYGRWLGIVDGRLSEYLGAVPLPASTEQVSPIPSSKVPAPKMPWLPGEKRSYVDLSTFGFLKGGTLSVQVTGFRVHVPTPLPNMDSMFGLSLDKTNSDGLSNYLVGEHVRRLYNEQGEAGGGKDDDLTVVLFTFNLSNSTVTLRRIGDNLKALDIYHNETEYNMYKSHRVPPSGGKSLRKMVKTKRQAEETEKTEKKPAGPEETDPKDKTQDTQQDTKTDNQPDQTETEEKGKEKAEDDTKTEDDTAKEQDKEAEITGDTDEKAEEKDEENNDEDDEKSKQTEEEEEEKAEDDSPEVAEPLMEHSLLYNLPMGQEKVKEVVYNLTFFVAIRELEEEAEDSKAKVTISMQVDVVEMNNNNYLSAGE